MKIGKIKINVVLFSVFMSAIAVAQVNMSANNGTMTLQQRAQQSGNAKVLDVSHEKAMVFGDALTKLSIDKLKINVKTAEDGVNGGGGVSVEDSNGRRQLLDLIEKDELEYFYPEKIIGAPAFCTGPAKLASVLPEKCNRSEMLYNLQSVVNGVYISRQGEHPANIGENIGDPEFVFTLLLSYESSQETFRRFYTYQDLKKYTPRSDANSWAKWTINPVKPLKWAFVDLELENISDEGEIRLENEKTKKQVAIQKNGLVIVSKREFQKLDRESRVALFLHESVLRSVLLLNPDNILKRGTQDVRTYTRRLYIYLKNPSEKPAYPVREAYESFQINDHSTFWSK